MVGALGNQIIFESNFKPQRVIQALHRLQGIVSFTWVGQTEDIYIENKGKATEKEYFRCMKIKLLNTLFEGPLHLGAILAGADEKFLKALSEIFHTDSIAFQIQDDILGVFGNEKKIGNQSAQTSAGKQTILVSKALEKADSRQRNILNSTLAKKI